MCNFEVNTIHIPEPPVTVCLTENFILRKELTPHDSVYFSITNCQCISLKTLSSLYIKETILIVFSASSKLAKSVLTREGTSYYRAREDFFSHIMVDGPVFLLALVFVCLQHI